MYHALSLAFVLPAIKTNFTLQDLGPTDKSRYLTCQISPEPLRCISAFFLRLHLWRNSHIAIWSFLSEIKHCEQMKNQGCGRVVWSAISVFKETLDPNRHESSLLGPCRSNERSVCINPPCHQVCRKHRASFITFLLRFKIVAKNWVSSPSDATTSPVWITILEKQENAGGSQTNNKLQNRHTHTLKINSWRRNREQQFPLYYRDCLYVNRSLIEVNRGHSC